jgi:YidC/Oxa1 family membrane protein insertase
MDRKLFTALALCVGIIWFWTKFVAVPPPPDPKHVATATDDGKSGAKPADTAAGKDAASDTAPAADAKPGANVDHDAKPAVPAARLAETFSTIEIAGRAHATLSSWGAALHDLVLVDRQYMEQSGDHEIPIDLVAPKDAPLPFAITFIDAGFRLPEDADYTLAPSTDPEDRRYLWSAGDVKVEKRWHFVPNTHEASITITVENNGDKPVPATLRLMVTGRQDPTVERSMLKPQVPQTEGLCSTGKVKRAALDSLRKEALDVTGAVRVVGIDRKFFALAAAMTPVDGARCHVEGSASGRIVVTYTGAPRSIAAHGKETWSLSTFIGPKVVSELDSAQVDGHDAHLSDVMNYGWTELFARPLLWVLKTIHRGVPNWGLAIILVTLLLKLLTWLPTTKSMESAQAMAKLKPEMDKLKEKYGDDKARMNQETMALYTKHKINPLGGCLPLLIQMPIYFAFYSMLSNSVELYHARFAFWIHDLTAPDPFFVLPIMTGAIMFLQQRFSPTPPDPSQKSMMTMMPIMFTGMSIFLPSGLALYILTNTGLSMIQQRLINNKQPVTDTSTAATSKNKKK